MTTPTGYIVARKHNNPDNDAWQRANNSAIACIIGLIHQERTQEDYAPVN